MLKLIKELNYHGAVELKSSNDDPPMSLCQTLTIQKPYRIIAIPTIAIIKFRPFRIDFMQDFTILAIMIRNPKLIF